jgi:UPF0755 protein
MNKRVGTTLIIAVVILLAVVGGMFSHAWQNFLKTPLVTAVQGLQYEVRFGSSYKNVSSDLHQQHILKYPFMFNLLFRIRGDTHHLKAGEYIFPYGATPDKMVDQMVSGSGLILHSFTIVPGMSFRQVRQALLKDRSLKHTTVNMSNATIMRRLGASESNPEGFFFPDTYYFVSNTSDMVVLKSAYNSMQQKLMKAWNTRGPNLPLKTPYEALIAASIIEKEADIKDELPIIAGVMMNRLRRDILLQFDPTVIYGEGTRFNGTIYRRDLLSKDNHYNTYVYKGLTPTPISMPSMEAIDAVMHPDDNNYLYFVARGDHMTHQFSQTLADHNVAVKAAKRYRSGYFNYGLLSQYLLKQFNKKIFNTN